jgi:hypothetical protein
MKKKHKKKISQKQIKKSLVHQPIYQQGVDIPQGVPSSIINRHNGRGYRVMTISSLRNLTGLDKKMQTIVTKTDNPYFYITPEDRFRIFQLCAPVLGIITSRMNRISGLNFNIVSDKKEEDRMYELMKDMHSLYNEYKNYSDIRYQIAAGFILTKIRKRLTDILPDLSNFDKSLVRWRKRIRFEKIDKCDEIKDWFMTPNRNEKWQDFIKQWVQDLMLHSTATIYKQLRDNKIDNIYILPGGTTFPFRDKYVSSEAIYFQVISGDQPQIFFPDEISYSQYIPTSMRSYGVIPIEALLNKITESLLFDNLMAEQADGTKFPEKMIIINDNVPFGDPDKDLKVNIDPNDQKRIEEKINHPVKGGIMTFSGDDVTVIDLSKENTMGIQSQRQKDIREDVALVFNMSNMEINLTGSGDTSGRSTSETQQEIEQGKGIAPILGQFENVANMDITPFRYGLNYSFEFEMTKSERETLEMLKLKMSTGLYATNEVKINELNEMPFDKEEYNYPPGAAMESKPDGSNINPFNFVSQNK